MHSGCRVQIRQPAGALCGVFMFCTYIVSLWILQLPGVCVRLTGESELVAGVNVGMTEKLTTIQSHAHTYSQFRIN